MTKNLIIVESPNKVKKIESFFNSDLDNELKGNKYKVIASVGHIRDLKKYGTKLRLGIDLEEMNPIYENISKKKDVIKKINTEAKKVTNIFLATDPDREGEAISWHIKEVIDQNKTKELNFYRVSFNEITKKAVINSVLNPSKINMDLVHSQEARRMLDRIIGFRLSFLASKKLKAPSAGRVKSSTLKLIIDRENEIKKFVPTFWWMIEGEINKDQKITNVDESFKEIKFNTLEEAEKVLSKLSKEFKFIKRETKDQKTQPPKPLEMATLLMGLFNNYGISNSRATLISQKLYEKGLISYPRTDSTRISSIEFIDNTKKMIIEKYGKENYKENLNKISKSKSNIKEQDSHEAIRPTDISVLSSDLTDLNSTEKKVYDFIWRTTIKSFMKEATNQTINDFYDNNSYFFKLKYSIVKDPGFKLVDDILASEPPKIKEKITLDLSKINVNEYSTKPPARYNQSSIIKKMKEEGIGRPSTYSSTTSGLLKYQYLVKEKNSLVPTEIAFEVNDLLISNFSDIIDEKYTSLMETKLDEIAAGNLDSKNFLKSFWKDFEPRINFADETIEIKLPEFVGRTCPKCNENELVYKRSRYGKFIGCSNWPDCKYIESLETNKNEPIILNEPKCSKCNSNLLIRKSKYGTYFIGCSNWPKCKNILPKDIAKPIIDENIKKEN